MDGFWNVSDWGSFLFLPEIFTAVLGAAIGEINCQSSRKLMITSRVNNELKEQFGKQKVTHDSWSLAFLGSNKKSFDNWLTLIKSRLQLLYPQLYCAPQKLEPISSNKHVVMWYSESPTDENKTFPQACFSVSGYSSIWVINIPQLTESQNQNQVHDHCLELNYFSYIKQILYIFAEFVCQTIL